jgi:membrane dipeptidase
MTRSLDSSELHAKSIVIDAVCPLVMDHPEYLDWYKEGGVTVLAPTIGSTESARAMLNRLAFWHAMFNQRDDLLLVRQARDVELAKQTGKLGIYLHMQGTDPIEDNLDLIDLYKVLGVGMVQLTYNVKNRVGDGCEEPTNSGLSRFGIRLVQRLNKARVIVDCSHTGLRTSLDAIEHSSAPVVLSHSNPASIRPSPRNVANELMDAIARTGGVIGVVGFPAMVSEGSRPSLDQFVAHIDAIVQRVGIDHVGLGIDYYTGQAGVAKDEDSIRDYEHAIRTGIWSTAYPPPPHHYPAGIETPRTLPKLTERLVQKGYDAAAVQKVLGANWVRVMRQVWG